MRAHPSPVAKWFTAPQRWNETVDSIRKQDGVSDLNEQTWEGNGLRIRELRWTCRHGRQGSLRLETVLGPDGVLLPVENGFEVRREQITRTHRQRAREVEVSYTSVFEFRGFPTLTGSLADLTEVVAVHRQLVTGGPWWERVLPPVTARRRTEKRAKEVARRCEAELTVTTSGGEPGA